MDIKSIKDFFFRIVEYFKKLYSKLHTNDNTIFAIWNGEIKQQQFEDMLNIMGEFGKVKVCFNYDSDSKLDLIENRIEEHSTNSDGTEIIKKSSEVAKFKNKKGSEFPLLSKQIKIKSIFIVAEKADDSEVEMKLRSITNKNFGVSLDMIIIEKMSK